jgi:hypothetical protein
MQRSKADSPCIKVCTLDAAAQMCIGCFRTIQEISNWLAYSDAQRESVCAQLPARRLLHASISAADQPASAGKTANARCDVCGAEFACGAHDVEQACWCTRFPSIAPPNPHTPSCLCPSCLARLANETR